MNSLSAATLPCADDITRAAKRLADHLTPTPLLEHPLLNKRLGFRLFVKAESLQPTGSFKFRGAMSKLTRLAEEGRLPKHVVAYSSGNHAQGVAAAAATFGCEAVIIMPHDAPAMKRKATESWGAEVIGYDRLTEDRMAIGRRIAEERDALLIPPYDDEDVIAGQGTCMLEVMDQLSLKNLVPDTVASPCGGGGLSSGTALYLSTHAPSAQFVTVEPEGWDDTARSIAAGQRLGNDGKGSMLCDALLAPMPGVMSLPVLLSAGTKSLTVSEPEVFDAMRLAYDIFHLVVEPGGAVALASALNGSLKPQTPGGAVVVILSGGNVDADVFQRALDA